MSRRLPVPPGLSAWAGRIWLQLTSRHDFADYELLALEKSLRWWDLSDRWLAESASLEGAAQAGKVKQSLDASQAGLRYWRTLKFAPPAGTARRIGRPAGDGWSARRADGATAFHAALAARKAR
jgi:hypothetical protein